MQQTYKNLGYFETMDQVSSARWFLNNYNYISKVGIWGWVNKHEQNMNKQT